MAAQGLGSNYCFEFKRKQKQGVMLTETLGSTKSKFSCEGLVPSEQRARMSISTTSAVFTLTALRSGEQSLINIEQLC